MLTLLFDGVAYGMLLFVLAVGLSITLGLMNFINLAHGAFAMLGGYAMVILFKHVDLPFLLCLPIVFVLVALVGALLERLLYRHLYQRSHLDQVLFFNWFGLHVGGCGRLFDGLFATKFGVALLAPRSRRMGRGRLELWFWVLQIVHHGGVRFADPGPSIDSFKHSIWLSIACRCG